MRLTAMKNTEVPQGHPMTLNHDAFFKAFMQLQGLDAPKKVSVFDGPTTSAPQQKEETMYTETQLQRQHLDRRLDQVSWQKDHELKSVFHLDANRPKSMKEAYDRLKAGDFKFNEKSLEEYGESDYFDSYDFASMIDWQTEEPDNAGYMAARKEMDKAKRDAQDTIAILDPKEGLETLKAFESATFH